MIFALAIFTPVLLTVSLLVTPYIGVFAACYAIYASSAPEQLGVLLNKWFDVPFMLDAYSQLFTYWRAHMEQADLVDYTTPLLALPLAGILLALWLTKRLVGWLANIFHMAGSH